MKHLFTLLIITLPLLGFSQEKDSLKEPFSLKDKLYLGGSFGLSFGNITFIDLSPQLGYKIREKLSAGIGIKYQYFSERNISSGYKSSASIYGGSLFARRKLTDQLFLSAELEHINIENYLYSPTQKWTNFFLVGAGYQSISRGGFSLNAQVLYDVLENPLLPYFYFSVVEGLPVILRIGASFGF